MQESAEVEVKPSTELIKRYEEENQHEIKSVTHLGPTGPARESVLVVAG